MVDISETVLWAARVNAAVRAFYGDAPADPETNARILRALAAAEAVTEPPPVPAALMPKAPPFDILHAPAQAVT